jgi:hypothetical protein
MIFAQFRYEKLEHINQLSIRKKLDKYYDMKSNK